MKKIFKPEMMQTLLWVAVVFSLLKLLWFVVDMKWLSHVNLNQKKPQESKALFYNVKLTPTRVAAPRPRPVVKPVIKKPVGNLKNIKLLAIYSAEDATVLTIQHKGKSKVISRGDMIEGYRLVGAGANFARFSKENKEYKVWLVKNINAENSMKMIKRVTPPKRERVPSEHLNEATNDDAEAHIIQRSMLNHYAENMDDIYQNIGVSEIKKGHDLAGFKINFVKRGSPFAKLGIRRNDVIKSINGKEITSYSAAFNVYKHLKEIDNLNIVIVRDNEEMELEYEIN